MNRIAIAAATALALGPTAAFALDWSINTSESETVELNSNQFLRDNPAGSVGSYSTLTSKAEALTPTSKFTVDGTGTYKKYWGPGASGSTTEFLTYGFHTRYDHSEKSQFDKEFIEANWGQSSTSLALLNDLGVIVPAGGFLDRLTATGGLDRALNARDTFSAFMTSTRTSYEPSSAGTAFTDTLARGSLRHSLNGTSAINVSSEAELLGYDNVFGTQIEIYRDQLGLDLALSPLLSFRGNVGSALVSTDRGVSTSALGGIASATPLSSSALDWIGDAALTYKIMKTATLSIVANQTIGPSIVGSLIKRDTLGVTWSYIVNSRENLSLSANASRQITSATSDSASVSATYAYNPIRDVSLQFSYRYQHRFASSGTAIIDPLTNTPTVSGPGPADSHSVLFVATHSFVLLPHGN